MSRVLVVEDDADIRTLIAARLKAAGHAVRAVEDGESALGAIDAAAPPDVMILDVGLPGMNGFDLLEQIRALPHTAHVPAIFLSARVQAHDIARGEDMGASYLTKPFIATALLARVHDAVTLQATAAW
jgi:DNA-binding response OmpR family regulator